MSPTRMQARLLHEFEIPRIPAVDVGTMSHGVGNPRRMPKLLILVLAPPILMRLDNSPLKYIVIDNNLRALESSQQAISLKFVNPSLHLTKSLAGNATFSTKLDGLLRLSLPNMSAATAFAEQQQVAKPAIGDTRGALATAFMVHKDGVT